MLAELRKDLPALHVVGLNAYESYDDRSDEGGLFMFLITSAPWLTVVHADKKMLTGLGGVPKIPSLYVFDGEGALVAAFARHTRALPPTAEEVRNVVRPLIRE
jgi:hypothetical protein